VGLPATHPASFRRNLQERFVSRVPLGRFVPDARKAAAVRAAVEGGISPERPAPALQRHGSCALYLDGPAASLLSPRAAS
jgi:sulfopyruvate decarboxylase TPP-binding subunit